MNEPKKDVEQIDREAVEIFRQMLETKLHKIIRAFRRYRLRTLLKKKHAARKVSNDNF